METRRTNKGGRPALADPAKHRHVLYLNDRENARFLSQWEQSGVTSKSRFIAARLFGEPFRGGESGQIGSRILRPADRILRPVPGGCSQLQPSRKGVAQQLFGEKALAFLYNLEKATTELAALNRQVIALTNECRELWLPK